MFGKRKGFKYCSKVSIKSPLKPDEWVVICTHYGDKQISENDTKALIKCYGEVLDYKVETTESE